MPRTSAEDDFLSLLIAFEVEGSSTRATQVRDFIHQLLTHETQSSSIHRIVLLMSSMRSQEDLSSFRVLSRRPSDLLPLERFLLQSSRSLYSQSVESVERSAATGESVGTIFEYHSERWRSETKFSSNYTVLVSHPDYLKIIGLGELAIPLILDDLANTRDGSWLLALRSITRIDVAEHAKNREDAIDAWLVWGGQKDFVSQNYRDRESPRQATVESRYGYA